MKRLSFTLLVLFFTLLSLNSQSQSLSLAETKNLSIKKIDGNKLILEFTATIENVSSKGIGLKVKKGKVYKNGEYIGTFRMLRKVKLKKNRKENLRIPVEVTLEKDINLLEEGINFLSGKSTEIKIEGMLKATWFIFWKRYPFELTEDVSMGSMF